MRALLRFFGAHALSLLADPRCCACDEPVPLETVFCRPCADTLVARAGAPTARGAVLEVAAFAYGGALREAITRFKYGRRDDLARPLAALLARARAPVAARRPDLVVPVPSHPARLARRTFEPAALLGRAFAEQLGVPCVVDALTRTRASSAQAGLDRASRLTNLVGAFECAPARVRGRRVVLVDDVRTTGATLSACTTALEAASAQVVAHAVLAAADS